MKSLFLLAMLFFIIISCSKDYETISIDSDIIVSAEKVGDAVVLNAETEKYYATLGHKITFNKKVKNNEIYVKFREVKVPNVGLTTLGPALCSINLDALKNGKYPIIFDHDNIETKGKLTVGASLELSIEPGSNVRAH